MQTLFAGPSEFQFSTAEGGDSTLLQLSKDWTKGQATETALVTLKGDVKVCPGHAVPLQLPLCLQPFLQPCVTEKQAHADPELSEIHVKQTSA